MARIEVEELFYFHVYNGNTSAEALSAWHTMTSLKLH